MNIELFITAIIPAIAIGLGVYYYDRYDREPAILLIKTFVLGGLSIIPTLFIEKFLLSLNIFQGIFGTAYTAFLVAGLTEEFFKRLVILWSIFKHKIFNQKLDGIVYSVFSALGFATVENVMYLFRFSTTSFVGLYRGVFSVPAHTLFAVTMGYYLSLAKFSQDRKKRRSFLRKSLWIPVLLHGIFNFILLSNSPLLMLLFIPFVIYLWIVNLKKLNGYALESKKDYDEHNKKNEL